MESLTGGGFRTEESGGLVPSWIAGIECVELRDHGGRAERIEESEGATTKRRESNAEHRADIAVAR